MHDRVKKKKKGGAVKLKDRGSGRPKKMCVGLKVLHSTVHTVK